MNINGKLNAARNFVTSSMGRKMLVMQKNSPHILFGVGVAGFAATTVLASRATLHLESVMDTHEENLSKRSTLIREGHELYTRDKQMQDLVSIHIRTGASLARLYAPALLAGSLSLACFTKSHLILNSRNAALTVAYATIDKAFREYRGRVREVYGEEVDLTMLHETETYKEKDENGKKVTKTRVDASAETPLYAKFFHRGNANWNNASPEYNLMFLRTQQNWLNDRLKSRGHVFLNEVYDELGIERTKAGAIVGWVYGGDGDDYIDFGIQDTKNEDRVYDFLVGREEEILLDFNVDGVIYDKI